MTTYDALTWTLSANNVSHDGSAAEEYKYGGTTITIQSTGHYEICGRVGWSTAPVFAVAICRSDVKTSSSTCMSTDIGIDNRCAGINTYGIIWITSGESLYLFSKSIFGIVSEEIWIRKIMEIAY